MGSSAPEVLDVLHDVSLRNGNVQRLQVVRYGHPPRCVVLLNVRELIAPELLHRTRPRCEVFVAGPDGRTWGLGRSKDWRIDHLEWVLENAERVRRAMVTAKARTISEGVRTDAFAGSSEKNPDKNPVNPR